MEDTTSWITFRIENQFLSIPTKNVEAIIREYKVTKIPGASSYIKGIIRYRDELFKLFNLRKILSFQDLESMHREFYQMLEQREKDHIKWLEELELSVRENREFKLTTDPTKCAFGKWYYSYKTDNLHLQRMLDRFEQPHDKIHAVAKTIESLKNEGNYEKANQVIIDTKSNELSTMIQLFKEFKIEYSKMIEENVILLKQNNSKCALTVDSVLAVESIEEIPKDEAQEVLQNKNTSVPLNINLGKRNNGDFTLMLSDQDFLESVF